MLALIQTNVRFQAWAKNGRLVPVILNLCQKFKEGQMGSVHSTTTTEVPRNSKEFRVRRFFNWFPLGLTYALLYMGRYNLTVSKTALGDLMSKADFGTIFGVGAWVYALAFLVNGPITDKIGGRRAMLIGSFGAAAANLAMGLYLGHVLSLADPKTASLTLVFS